MYEIFSQRARATKGLMLVDHTSDGYRSLKREKERERGKGAESKRVKGREEVRVIDGKLNGRMDGGLTPERPLNSDLFYRPLPHESGEF